MTTPSSKRMFSQIEDDTISRQSQSLKDSDIAWFGDYTTCSEQLKHYSLFSWRGTRIEVHSFVWIQNEDSDQAEIGYIEDMYEDLHGTKIVRARYFIRAKEIKHRVPGLRPKPKEIMLTPSMHEVQADSIDGVATVLNLEHFERCLEFLPRTLAYEVFVSEREYKDDGTLCPFVLSELEGYSKQPIFSCLKHFEGRRHVVMALESPMAPSSLLEKSRRRRSKKLL